MDNFDKEEKYIRAKERVFAIKKFYSNLMSYIVFIGFLAALNYYVNQWRNPWFLWAAFGWGLGIIFNAIKTFDFMPFMGKSWEDRKIKEFMDKEDNTTVNRWS